MSAFILTDVIRPESWIPQFVTQEVDVLFGGTNENNALQMFHTLVGTGRIDALEQIHFLLQHVRLTECHRNDAGLMAPNGG